jgi:hypothetical protein
MSTEQVKAMQVMQEHDWPTIWTIMERLGMVDGLGGMEYEHRTAEMIAEGSLVARDGGLYLRGEKRVSLLITASIPPRRLSPASLSSNGQRPTLTRPASSQSRASLINMGVSERASCIGVPSTPNSL